MELFENSIMISFALEHSLFALKGACFPARACIRPSPKLNPLCWAPRTPPDLGLLQLLFVSLVLWLMRI